MTSFISGPILQVQLDGRTKHWQDVTDEITVWRVVNVLEIDSNNDQNIHWTRNLIFSILLDPSIVQGLELPITDVDHLQLERVFNSQSSTESWRVL